MTYQEIIKEYESKHLSFFEVFDLLKERSNEIETKIKELAKQKRTEKVYENGTNFLNESAKIDDLEKVILDAIYFEVLKKTTTNLNLYSDFFVMQESILKLEQAKERKKNNSEISILENDVKNKIEQYISDLKEFKEKI